MLKQLKMSLFKAKISNWKLKSPKWMQITMIDLPLYSWKLWIKVIHFFNALRASYLGSPLKGMTWGFYPLAFGGSFFYILPGLYLASILPPLLTLSSDLSSPSLFPYLCFIFFWYLRICWAANSNMLASGRPFLHIALRKYSYASSIPDCSRTPTISL